MSCDLNGSLTLFSAMYFCILVDQYKETAKVQGGVIIDLCTCLCSANKSQVQYIHKALKCLILHRRGGDRSVVPSV